jgi:ABC-2 type transport system ATP-binding protein
MYDYLVPVINSSISSTSSLHATTPTGAVASTHEMTIRYGSRTILDGLSVEFPLGCTGLLGPNGAGKTTLIKSLMGFLEPVSGTRTVLGRDVAADPINVRQFIGLMPEQDCHIPGMNAVTFVAYAGELAGMPAAQAMRRAHEVLEYCSLGEARYRNVETYSTGIKLAQALVHGPKLLFLDEPTNGLDPQGRDEMLNLVHDVSHGKGLSVIVSSHLLPDIERTCDNVVVMRTGRVVKQGSIGELLQGGNPEVDVELTAYSQPFVDAMAMRGAVLLQRIGAGVRFSLPPVYVHAAGRLVFESARDAAGAQVRSFQPAQRRLEDVFREALES